MGEFNLKDLEKIYRQEEIMDFLIEHDIIKEEKFVKELRYEKELKALQYELVHLQAYLAKTGKKMALIFEGRDAAGKGGTIKRIVKNLNPKRYHIVALPKPTEKEQGQWYFQRYIEQLPSAGYFAFFDRSWYNRAVVEPVFGFCTQEEHQLFMSEVNQVEQRLVNDGFIFIKFFLDITKDEQKERLEAREKDPLKQWKLGGLDKQAIEKWDVYSHYIEKMLTETSTPDLPWIQIKTDSKKTARLETIKYLLTHVDGFEPSRSLQLDDKVIIKHT